MPDKVDLGPSPCTPCTIPELLEEIRFLLRERSTRPRSILDLNAHIYNLAWGGETLRKSLRAARIVSADGMGLVWAARLFDRRFRERCNSTEAFRAFLLDAGMAPTKGLLVGCTQAEVEAAARAIEGMSPHCRIVKAVSGFLDDAGYRQLFTETPGLDFIYLGLSTPRTQQVADIAVAVRPEVITWGVGAGTIKIFAGTMKEPPAFWRRTGLQWLYRLCSDPANLWRRYVIGNPLFVARVIAARFAARKPHP